VDALIVGGRQVGGTGRGSGRVGGGEKKHLAWGRFWSAAAELVKTVRRRRRRWWNCAERRRHGRWRRAADRREDFLESRRSAALATPPRLFFTFLRDQDTAPLRHGLVSKSSRRLSIFFLFSATFVLPCAPHRERCFSQKRAERQVCLGVSQKICNDRAASRTRLSRNSSRHSEDARHCNCLFSPGQFHHLRLSRHPRSIAAALQNTLQQVYHAPPGPAPLHWASNHWRRHIKHQ